MLSLKKQQETAPSAESALSAKLLAAVAQHTVCVDPRAHADFQASIERSARDLARTDLPAADRELLTASVVHTMEHYAESSQAQIQSRLDQLNAIIGLLTGSIESAAAARGESVASIESLRQQILHCAQSDDLTHLRQRLGEALEALPLTAKSAGAAEPAPEALPDAAPESLPMAARPAAAETDGVTGLVNLARHPAPLEDAYAAAGSWLAVPILVDRLYAVSVRYGDDASAQLLSWATRFIQSKLLPKDVLLTWNGKCFVALLYRKMRGAFARREVTRIVGSRAEHNLLVGDREILIPVTFSWIIYPLEEHTDARAVLNQIETFVNKRGL